jgi:hypothetical protein
VNLTSCCCGNVLGPARCRVIVHPCQCPQPGPVKRRPPMTMLPKQITEAVYNERRAAGLPLMTPTERAAFTESRR